MSGFFQHYFKIHGGEKEQAVNCPFPHHTSNGLQYFEVNPSAHVNLKENVFHCKVCGAGHSENSFIKAVLNCSLADAVRLSKAFNNTETIEEWDKYATINTDMISMCNNLGINTEVIRELHLTSQVDGTICFPVFMLGHLIDVRQYTPGGDPKIKSRTGAASGLVIPLDIWQAEPSNRTTLICAGEKDMANARSHGFNAITITGGEMALPLSPAWFKDKDVVILYDNDDAGRVGANKLATYLLGYCRTVKVCTAFHEVCKEDKEDITDFFVKYGGTSEQLIAFMNNTPYYTPQDCVHNSTLPLVNLQEATSPKFVNKMVRTNIQVVAVSEAQYVVPTTIIAEKLKNAGKDDVMFPGEVREWELTEHTVQDILHLTDNGFKESDITNNIKMLLHISPKERYIRISKHDKAIVYKAYVTDMFESMNTDTMPMEYVVYSIGTRLESGKKYMVTHKLVPHPYKGQQLIMLITDAVQANDSVSNFVLTNEKIQDLKVIQELPGSVEEKINALTQKVKGLLGYNGNDLLIQIIDLAFHTVLNFNLGSFKNVRGYLDTLIVGESRVGKSSTAETLRQTYQLGTFTSLAGNSATIPGLIGGSNKTTGGAYQTKAGLIPQNHKGLIIFEEFGKCKQDIVAELTDIRSSNEVRITRISGTISLPAMVRMISLSNVKSYNGEIKSIASYPNGIAIVTELVGTAEDIARYDILAVLGYKGDTQIDPFWQPDTPLADEVYRTRIRWVWSRTAEQIIISEEVGRYIIEQANALNKAYDCHIKIFGTEAWKKLSRLSIAVAGYLVSTDETYSNIVLTKEHVDYAVNMYKRLYDNPTFRLKEYVENERKYNVIDNAGVELLTVLYQKIPSLLLMLEQEARPSRNTLMAAVGLDNATYNGYINQLVRGSFVRLVGNDILPTERFRLGMAKIDRTTLRRVGETNA